MYAYLTAATGLSINLLLIVLYVTGNIYQGDDPLCNSWHILHYRTNAFSATYANATLLVKVLKCPWLNLSEMEFSVLLNTLY